MLPHTLGLEAAIWRVLDKAHQLRNLAEYEGHAEVDMRLLDELVEMVENTRLRHTDTFDAPGSPGQMDVLIEFRDVISGTELSIVQSGIPAMIPAEFCVLGWQESLAMLTPLVEPGIPDGA